MKKYIIIGLLLLGVNSLSWAEDDQGSCRIVYSCEIDSRYTFSRTDGSILRLPKESFIFWLTGESVDFDYQTNKGIFGDGSLPLELDIFDCKSISDTVEDLAKGKTPIYYGFSARNPYASIKFKDKKLSGVYSNEAIKRIDVFTASCSVVGTPNA